MSWLGNLLGLNNEGNVKKKVNEINAKTNTKKQQSNNATKPSNIIKLNNDRITIILSDNIIEAIKQAIDLINKEKKEYNDQSNGTNQYVMQSIIDNIIIITKWIDHLLEQNTDFYKLKNKIINITHKNSIFRQKNKNWENVQPSKIFDDTISELKSVLKLYEIWSKENDFVPKYSFKMLSNGNVEITDKHGNITCVHNHKNIDLNKCNDETYCKDLLLIGNFSGIKKNKMAEEFIKHFKNQSVAKQLGISYQLLKTIGWPKHNNKMVKIDEMTKEVRQNDVVKKALINAGFTDAEINNDVLKTDTKYRELLKLMIEIVNMQPDIINMNQQINNQPLFPTSNERIKMTRKQLLHK